MDRQIIYDQSQGRDYDVLWGWRETLFATSALVSDILGQTSTVVSGLVATASGPTSLVINLAAGNVYQLSDVDGAAYGSLTADARQVMQQGFYAGGTLTLTTSGLSSGQSRWALIEATFTQTDSIPGDDPNGGLLAFLNTTDPSGPPWSGPANAGTTLPTRRKSVCTLSVIYGTAASSGTEVPPAASAGNVGLYLIDLAFGQTAVAQNQILTAGPSVGTGVPSNYPVAPFLAGLLNSHHNGKAGQAAKINLATETQGTLPGSSVSGIRTQLTANLSLFVNGSTGNDSNNGLSSGTAFATIARAAVVAATNYEVNGWAITIQVAAGTYTSTIIRGPILGAVLGPGALIINGASAATVTIDGGALPAIFAFFGAALTVQNMTLTTTTLNAPSISSSAGAYVLVGTGMVFATAGGADMSAADGGKIVIGANYSVTGSATAHFSAIGGNISVASGVSPTITLSGTPAFSVGFAQASGLGSLAIPSTSVTFTGSATGLRYTSILNSLINTAGAAVTFFPGSITGTTATGGLYA